MRGNAADRAARDIPVADYLQAFRVFHRIVMDAILRESRHQAGGEPALDAARGLLEKGAVRPGALGSGPVPDE